MKFNPLTKATAASVAAILALPAFAQPPAEETSASGHPMMMRLDTDQDGRVSQEEFRKGHAQRFSQLDTDGDGTVSLEELTAGAPRHRHGMGMGQGRMPDEARAQYRQQFMRQRFEEADTDGDGNLSPDEFAALGATHFARMDADGDGAVGPGEMGHGRHHRHSDHPAPGADDSS